MNLTTVVHFIEEALPSQISSLGKRPREREREAGFKIVQLLAKNPSVKIISLRGFLRIQVGSVSLATR